jgi:signal transduction histidine kinase
VATMLVLVFLYAPLRTWISRLLARILGRSRPSAESAVESLLDRANLLGDAQASLEQTLAWTLRPGSIRWIRPGGGWDPALADLADTGGCLGQELSGVGEADAADLWVPVREGGGTSALVLVPDIGLGWRRADRDLARLLTRAAEPLLESQGLKRERDALQREMHDGLGNQLYGLSLLSQDAVSVPVEILRDRMERIQSTSQDAIESLRTGLAILSEPSGAFGPALAKLLMRAEDHLGGAGIRLETSIEDEVAELALDGRHSFAFLRAMQEALGNVARHSAAAVVLVTARVRDGRLAATVADDGKGFDPSVVGHGLGLGNIQRRLSESGGVARVESSSGRGTRIVLELPLQRRDEP